MSNRIDQLFKDKLNDHKDSPSPEAWTKVQSGLSKKNKLVIVWRMAAVFVLFGALIGTWYFINDKESITPTQLSKQNEIITPENNSSQIPKEPASDNSQQNVAQKIKPENRKKINDNRDIKKKIESSSKENIAMENSELQNQVDEKLIVTEPILIAESVKSEKATVIEFTLESIAQEPKTAVAQTTEVESTGLKKILETALDVKNGDSDLSIIRDAKNQLLALDFKKDKPKRN